MRKVVLLIAFLIGVIALLYFIPVTKKETVPVATNLYTITSTILQPEHWKRWQPTIQSAYAKDSTRVQVANGRKNAFTISIPQHRFDVISISPLLYTVQETNNGHTSQYALNIIPVKDDTVNLLLVKKTNGLGWLFPSSQSAADVTAHSLKQFLETPGAFYGYPVDIKKVTDTVIATQKIRVSKKELFQALPSAFQSLQQYIEQQGLQAVNNWEVSYNNANNDSLDVMTGIPVNEPAEAVGKVRCLHIPKGRMLVSYYEGRFGDRKKIYTALERYIADQHLMKVAIPFEKYTGNLLPTSDSAIVKFELYYPVY